jgi:DNA-3-methyladenine glycosylase I
MSMTIRGRLPADNLNLAELSSAIYPDESDVKSLPFIPQPSPLILSSMPRCPWATTEPNITYHDKEWGVPVHDDRKLFEFLILEGAQAGLSWTTILNKRENYRKAFDQFSAEKIARYGARDVKRLLRDAGIVRNRLKIAATIQNAKALRAVQKEFGSFDAYLWGFIGGKPIQNRWRSMADVPARTAESDAMSRDLQQRGFKFVGSTICYALMQATGLVNDHLVTCLRNRELRGMPRRK